MIWIFKRLNILIFILHLSICTFNVFSYSRLYFLRVKGIKHFVSLAFYNIFVLRTMSSN